MFFFVLALVAFYYFQLVKQNFFPETYLAQRWIPNFYFILTIKNFVLLCLMVLLRPGRTVKLFLQHCM